MSLPPVDAVREAARTVGVCVRPIVAKVTDVETGECRMVPIACGSTREAQCPPFADRARRLRMHQCREGWHLTEEPERLGDDDDQEDDDLGEVGGRGRRVRSTRRRQDVPDLPRLPVEQRTVGRVFVAPNGKRYRPGYLCKYLTKSIAGTHREPDRPESGARAAHFDRLAHEVRWLPCSPTCANWLRFGVQPESAGPGLVPGHCTGKAHDRQNLGLGGRRVLVSRHWTGKTLAAHKADRAAVVQAALEEAGIDPDDPDEFSIIGSDGRWTWEVLGRSRVDQRTYVSAMAHAICTRQRWRAQHERAKARRPAMTGRVA